MKRIIINMTYSCRGWYDILTINERKRHENRQINQFEVSRRTINRDIEDLCKAGIPIVTKRGVNGGISIMDNYKLEHTLLTNTEMQDILAGLRSLDSINGTNRYGQLMEKLAAGTSDFMTGNQSIFIDLSSWYKESFAPKIDLIIPYLSVVQLVCVGVVRYPIKKTIYF